ncbi:MAG: 3'-5' exonuclease [Deltaproteobacteria bacterium]|nr:3'-5' exonuclease [Deltaproteobacteria bacterium]
MRSLTRSREETTLPPESTDPAVRHVVFDLETTGLWPRRGHRVIEIGAVALEQGVVVEEFSTLVDAGVPVPPEVQAIHGISGAMLEGEPKPEEILPRFSTFIADSVLVAHNAAFDVGFLRHEFARLGMPLPNPHLCTLEMSRRHFPHLADHTLETVYLHLFPEAGFLRQSHRALDDARMTAKIWLKMAGE